MSCAASMPPTARSSSTAAALGGPEQPGVVDRDRRPLGEHDDRLDVVVVEVLGALLLGEVEVAPGLAANDDRRAEEAAHRRVPGREAVGARVLGDVVQPDRHRLVDQQPEDAAAARQVADRGVDRRLLAGGQELRQLAALVVEHAERGVARAAQLAGGLHHALQQDVEIELGRQRAADVQQLAQAVGAEQMAIVACGRSARIAPG